MMVQTARVEIDCEADGTDVAEVLRSLTCGGPFAVADVESAGPGRLRCHFRLTRADMAVGYRSVIELQHRIDREFHILRVDHQSTHFSNKDLVLS
jgi:hypothetical protein